MGRRILAIEPETAAGRLLQPDVRCPGCGRPPGLRITERERDDAFLEPAALVKVTYKCARKACCIYEITAGAFQRAA
jgi:hypothetical protein